MSELGEFEIFCLLAGGVEVAADEPGFDSAEFFSVRLLGVEGCDSPLGGVALPIKLLARAKTTVVASNIKGLQDYFTYSIVPLCDIVRQKYEQPQGYCEHYRLISQAP